MRYSSFILFPIITICICCAYEIIVVLFGIEFADSKGCFQVLCVGALVTTLSQPGSAMIYAANKQNFIFKVGCILAIINIGLNFWLIPKYGAFGAALCYTSVTSAGVFYGYYYVFRYLDLRAPWLSLIKISFSCILLSLMLFLLIRIDTNYFDLFIPFRQYVLAASGYSIDFLFNSRIVRLGFTIVMGSFVYILMSLMLFKPDKDDYKIIESLDRYFPKYGIKMLLQWKQK